MIGSSYAPKYLSYIFIALINIWEKYNQAKRSTVHTLPANWKTTDKVSPLRVLLLELFAAKYDLKAALVRFGGVYYRFLYILVIILYEMKEGELEEKPDFWKR